MLSPPAGTRPVTVAEFADALGTLARFETGPFLAVAVSGGPDSLALAILAERWARERGGAICALSVDHRLRPESGAEIRRLHEWLSARAIRHEVLVWSGEKPASGIQEAARAARYRLLAGWCREHGCLHLLTAHHREDQAETHLIRRRAGSGADGLAGMSAIREFADCRLLRPLLGVAKARLVALLEAEGQPFLTDPSNRNPVFERSRLRAADGAASGVAEIDALLSVIGTFGRRRTLRERARNELLARTLSLHPAGFGLIDQGLVRSAPRDTAEPVLAAIAAAIGGGAYPPRRERVARLHQALAGAGNRGHTLGGCRFVAWRGRILVLRELAAAAAPMLLTPGASLDWDRRFRATLPAAAAAPVTIGYLGRPGVAMGVAELYRRAPQLRCQSLPRLLRPILPAVWDEEGIAAVPHLGYRREGVELLPKILFRPVNPPSSAGFAVV